MWARPRSPRTSAIRWGKNRSLGGSLRQPCLHRHGAPIAVAVTHGPAHGTISKCSGGVLNVVALVPSGVTPRPMGKNAAFLGKRGVAGGKSIDRLPHRMKLMPQTPRHLPQTLKLLRETISPPPETIRSHWRTPELLPQTLELFRRTLWFWRKHSSFPGKRFSFCGGCFILFGKPLSPPANAQ